MDLLMSMFVVMLFTSHINTNAIMNTKLNAPVQTYISGVENSFSGIPDERKQALEKLARYVASKTKANEAAQLIFICTHNSRRSHMAQIWAQTAAYYYGVASVRTFSGGTEATAFNPNAVAAMKAAGFDISTVNAGDNPEYAVSFSVDAPPIVAFSKTFDHHANPQRDFCAVMTCSHADQNCPFIPGASLRVAIPYEDPKDFDGTEKEGQAYRERCSQIATEMFYLFSLVNG